MDELVLDTPKLSGRTHAAPSQSLKPGQDCGHPEVDLFGAPSLVLGPKRNRAIFDHFLGVGAD